MRVSLPVISTSGLCEEKSRHVGIAGQVLVVEKQKDRRVDGTRLATTHVHVNMARNYYVYILTNRSRTFYVGMTDSLERRVFEHKHKLIEGFTKRYNITRLAY